MALKSSIVLFLRSLDKSDESMQNIKVKVKVMAHTQESAFQSTKMNILYILDVKVEPQYCPEESRLDFKSIDNIYKNEYTFLVNLPDQIVFVDENDVREWWRNPVTGISASLKDFIII